MKRLNPSLLVASVWHDRIWFAHTSGAEDASEPAAERQNCAGIIGHRFLTYWIDMNTTPSGLQYEDTTVGEGAEAKAGQDVVVHYTGWLYKDGQQGAKFDSSKDRRDPFVFALGAGMVIRGWDEGVAGMKVGGARTLIIPPELGYGARGAGGVIPPNATLKFDVELLAVE